MKDWIETNFSTVKHIDLNRIINKHCKNFCMECWKDRNQKLHNTKE